MYINFVYGAPGVWNACISHPFNWQGLKRLVLEVWEALHHRNCLIDDVYVSLKPHDYQLLLDMID